MLIPHHGSLNGSVTDDLNYIVESFYYVYVVIFEVLKGIKLSVKYWWVSRLLFGAYISRKYKTLFPLALNDILIELSI